MNKDSEEIKCVSCGSDNLEVRGEVEDEFQYTIIYQCADCGKIFTDEEYEDEI